MQKIQNFRQLHCPCKTDDIFKDSAKDVETRFGTSTFKQTDFYLKEKIKK